MRLLITDLDNTLYDWVTFFAKSFTAMTRELVPLLGVPEEQILDEFQAVHRKYSNSEQPFAVLELPSVIRRFGALPRKELQQRLAVPLNAFNSCRDEHLRLYPSVGQTLDNLRSSGVRIIGHTEAIGVNAYYRLKRLGILHCFQHLYVLEGRLLPHPDPDRQAEWALPSTLIREVPISERKPNPRLLLDICEREGVSPKDACYVGDSISRDVAMAEAAGVVSAWARYGLQYDPGLWRVLVRVTHWTNEDVAREADLKSRAAQVKPTHTLDSFADLLDIMRAQGGTSVSALS